jgi:predicted GIY-YIG superfamily endonuclease
MGGWVYIENAIPREKRLEKWNRRWKIDLIERDNPSGTISTGD